MELTNIAEQMSTFHKSYLLYLTPTTATVAPKNTDPIVLPADTQRIEKMATLPFDQQMSLIYEAWLHGLAKTPFTQLANLSGEPAISLPTYVSASGLPLGVQFEAGRNQDDVLLALGNLFEQAGLFKEWPRPAKPELPATGTNTSSPVKVHQQESSKSRIQTVSHQQGSSKTPVLNVTYSFSNTSLTSSSTGSTTTLVQTNNVKSIERRRIVGTQSNNALLPVTRLAVVRPEISSKQVVIGRVATNTRHNEKLPQTDQTTNWLITDLGTSFLFTLTLWFVLKRKKSSVSEHQ